MPVTKSRKELLGKSQGEARDFGPLHPGTYLLEELLNPMKISQNDLARRLDVSVRTVNEIVRGRRSVTAEMALRLGRFFGMTPEFWLNLQKRYDLEVAREAIQHQLDNIEPFERAA